jgi:hypothetical protein
LKMRGRACLHYSKTWTSVQNHSSILLKMILRGSMDSWLFACSYGVFVTVAIVVRCIVRNNAVSAACCLQSQLILWEPPGKNPAGRAVESVEFVTVRATSPGMFRRTATITLSILRKWEGTKYPLCQTLGYMYDPCEHASRQSRFLEAISSLWGSWNVFNDVRSPMECAIRASWLVLSRESWAE